NRPGVRPLALAQLFERGNDGVRSALHVADEIGHSLPVGVQYDQRRKPSISYSLANFMFCFLTASLCDLARGKSSSTKTRFFAAYSWNCGLEKISACMSLQ